MPMDKALEGLEQLKDGTKTILVCSCGGKIDAADKDIEKWTTAHKKHFDHLAPDYVVPTIIG